ncbi:hypothetical protein [Rhizobium chutanense]|uniref:hypothetical protein n=1 Tax=Rhizobium chutanense TaxID=2035448 RepID=UPI001FDFBCE4|nr:hypothetical protein [Rhizobium chutanense]
MRDEPCSTDAGNAGNSGSQRLDWRLMLPVFIIVSLDAASSSAILPMLPSSSGLSARRLLPA